MATADTHSEHDAHHDDHHDHGEFIAHHFDSPRQQFDSGKLGIWLFLVTEILFFSGLFVAYTLYRNLQPEIFAQAHVFLDKYLGALNTLVLLFSSLTMAWAVRSAQLGKNKAVTFFVLITMVCAAMFIGVKAIEYSHKWDMNILVRSGFAYDGSHAEPTMPLAISLGISDYLVYLSAIPALLLVAFTGLAGFFKMTGKAHLGTFMACMAITVAGYFLGAASGQIYMNVTDGGLGGHANAPPLMLYAQETEKAHDEATHADDGHSEHSADDKHADDDHAHGDDGHTHAADGHHDEHDDHGGGHGPDPSKMHQDIGTFFSIYYCMTGLHAIHIIAGIGFLAWILWRSILGHWRPDYFGPVDYVGLYWHLVDLIWIYLFPLLYLID